MGEPERIEEEENDPIEAKWFTEDIIKRMILENLKQYVLFVITMSNDEINHLAKYIKESKSKARLQHDSNMKKVKEDVSNSAMALIKGREMVFKASERRIFSRLEQLEQSEQSEQPEQSS